MITPNQIQVAFSSLAHLYTVELGPIVNNWERKEHGRELTPAEARLKDAALATLTEFLNDKDAVNADLPPTPPPAAASSGEQPMEPVPAQP